LDEFLHADSPLVSTIGYEGEGHLRRFRRLTVADTLSRFAAQTTGAPSQVIGLPGPDRATLVPGAVAILTELPGSRLAIHGDHLVLAGDDLLADILAASTDSRWPESVLAAQRVAIGGSPGALVRFARTDGGGDIEVFTTRPDTIFGASFLAVSPTHPLARLAEPAQWDAFRAECARVADDPRAKAGVPLGIEVANPFLPDRTLPVWLGNFVVDSYGTGAAGGCPACDQRDLDFARRYGLPVYSIVCPPGEDPGTYEVGPSSYAENAGIIINSGFLSGRPVAEAIPAAIAQLVELGRAAPTVQFRRRALVLAQSAPPAESDASSLVGSWRFTDGFLTAAALVGPVDRPHTLHVTVAETATRHLLETRVLHRALGRSSAEPWDEVVLIGDVTGPAVLPVGPADALRVAILSDAPPERDLDWSDQRYAAAVKFVEGASRLLEPTSTGLDRDALAGTVTRAAASLENSLQRRRTNTAVAAVREIVAAASGTPLSRPALVFLVSLLYSVLPDVAVQGLDGSTAVPAWPRTHAPGIAADLVELVVQVNGKKRAVIQVARDGDEQAVVQAVLADAALQAHLGGKPVRKTIVVPNRLVNILV
jgi:leucyl-tRNA synthetase